MVEAGLGGRHDATNVLGGAGRGAHQRRPRAHALARPDDHRHRAREARRRGARRRRSWSGELRPRGRGRGRRRSTRASSRADPAAGVAAHAASSARNFAVARAAAEALLGALDDGRGAARRVARRPCPGASRSSPRTPLTIYDGAHNPSGIAALAAALRDAVGERPLVAVLSVLDDKDAAGMLRELVAAAARRGLHRVAQPARALAGDARVAVRASWRARRREIEADPHAARAARPRARRAGRRRRGDRLDLPRRRPAVAPGRRRRASAL